MDALPVAKGCGGGGPAGWCSGLFADAGPLQWLIPDADAAPDKGVPDEGAASGGNGGGGRARAGGGDGGAAAAVPAEATEAPPSEAPPSEAPTSDALRRLPFGSGSHNGCGGHRSAVPVPLAQVEELLAMAQVSNAARVCRVRALFLIE